MDDALLSRVIDLLSDAVLDAEVEELVLSACQGSEELNTVVHGGSVETPTPNPEPIQPLGAYLREIRVSGFRGIGPTAVLPIKAGAGLTVVIGRNGSGKSSFAEALELLLTGSAERLERSQVFAKGWRNLHQREPCAIEADFVVEGESGVATARRSWQASDDTVGAGASTFQLPGRQRGSLDQLGWKRGLQTYRPFLSHGELEVFLGRPSELHDKIAAVLATDDLETATKRLADERFSAISANLLSSTVLPTPRSPIGM